MWSIIIKKEVFFSVFSFFVIAFGNVTCQLHGSVAVTMLVLTVIKYRKFNTIIIILI